jgi:lipoprotein-releasing system permease protein
MYKFILATRYLIKRRITYLAMLSVCLCVFMVVVVMTVMAGLVNDFKTENHQWVGDCVISSDSLVGFPYYEEFLEILDRQTFVEASSPVVQTYGILTPGSSDRNTGVEIMGFDPERHCRVTNFGQTIHYHKNDCASVFKPDYNPNLPGCVLAIDKAVARDSRGRYWQEPKIPVASVAVSCFPLTPKGTLAKAGLGLVNTKTFYYSDNSHSGLAKVDNSFIYVPLDDAQLLCGMAGTEKRVNAIHIRFKPHTNLESGCRQVAKLWTAFVAEKKNQQWASLFDSVSVQGWKGFRRDVIAAVETEQMMMTVAFAMIGIIAVFIVFVVFYMIVSHKTKDIGILKSIGVSDENIVGLFLGFALMVGVLSSAAGAFLGWLFLMNINKIEDILFERFGFQLWDRTFYAIGEIPNSVDAKVLAAVMLSAVFVCLIGAFIPSRQAAKLQPVETLRVGRL